MCVCVRDMCYVCFCVCVHDVYVRARHVCVCVYVRARHVCVFVIRPCVWCVCVCMSVYTCVFVYLCVCVFVYVCGCHGIPQTYISISLPKHPVWRPELQSSTTAHCSASPGLLWWAASNDIGSATGSFGNTAGLPFLSVGRRSCTVCCRWIRRGEVVKVSSHMVAWDRECTFLSHRK